MCSRFKPLASAPLQGDFTQWITADFNNDSYDKWLLIYFLVSENMQICIGKRNVIEIILLKQYP